MADDETEVKEQETGTETEGETDGGDTVYTKVSGALDLPYAEKEYDSLEEYKQSLCRAFNKLTDEQYKELDDDATEWLNACTKIVSANRGARKKAPLPHLPGLEGDVAAVEKKGKGKAKAAKTDDEETGEKKKRGRPKKEEGATESERDPTKNRTYRVSRLLIDKPDMTNEDVGATLRKQGHDYGNATIAYTTTAFRIVHRALKDAGKLAGKRAD